MALFDGRRRVAHYERELANLRAAIPADVAPGLPMTSPYVTESAARSLIPWRRRTAEITEAARPTQAQRTTAPARAGYLGDVPRGGANEYNQGYTQIGGATDRRTLMEQMQQLYVACPWVAACVDTIARTCSAGGMDIVPIDQGTERLEGVEISSQAAKAQALFEYVNPNENFRQLMRGIFTDLLIYGDSFIEVVWALGEPIALFSLPCPDMLINADEHGVITGYVQRTETNRRAEFKSHQVIHIKFDSPRSGLYGLGPTEKSVHPIVTWIQTEALVKKIMQKGNPPNLAIAWDRDLDPNVIKERSQKFAARNLGPENVGNPIELQGDTNVHIFAPSPLGEYNAVKDKCRDETCAGYGVPPAEVTIIESGNIGGGTGTSQRKTFEINTCGPLQELVLEAFTFSILSQGFGVTDSRCKFGEIDWRDDEIIEKIRTDRVKTMGWTPNRYRDEIGEPAAAGGDDPLIVLSRDVVLLKDVAAVSAAKATAPGALPEVGADSGGSQGAPKAAPAAPGVEGDQVDPKHARGTPAPARESGPVVITESAAHTGAMIALFLPTVLAGELALDDGEAADELHVTLAYLGDAADLGNTDALAAVVAAWALETPPLPAEISGVGLFNPQGDGNPPVTYASVDSPNLAAARHHLVEQLKRAGVPANTDHGFTPHVTIAYDDAVDRVATDAQEFTFGAVTLAIAGERQSWPLTGTPLESAPDAELFEAWTRDFEARRRRAMKELV